VADPSPHATTLSFGYDSPARARTVERSVRVETGGVDDDRSTVTVDRDGDTVRVRVDAEDLVALRAGVNSWFRLLAAPDAVATAAGDPPSDH